MWRIIEDIERMKRKMERIMAELAAEIEKPMWDYRTKCLEPLVSVKEGEENITVTVDLPCVEKENIKLYATERTLTIQATLKEEYRSRRMGITREEVSFEHFKKVIELPKNVIPEKAKAKFKNGILEVILPKKISGREIRIE